ncbi:hypothetical protein [Actinoplanes sp. GCM10030250]|uniref:hypothetical protein n=1 Tax=Actinoplanes sp. GCM10030250 TaxID=3273376 RepID=UPI0036223D8D
MTTDDDRVVFAGPPELVEGFVPVDPANRRDIRVLLASDDGYQQVRALTAPAGGQTLVRLVLPGAMPPDEVAAQVQVGDQRYEAVVRPGPHTQLECSPARLDLEPGDAPAEATLRIVNVGNTSVDVAKVSGFGLMREGGVDSAIGAGLRTGDRGLDRLGHFADTLAELHGGLVRVSVRSGAGILEPSSATTVRAVFDIDRAELVPGRRYSGVWVIATLRVPVSVSPSTPPAQPKPTRRRRTPKGQTS